MTQNKVWLTETEFFTVEGVEVITYKDHPKMRVSREDSKPSMGRAVRSLVLHTTMGAWPQALVQGTPGPSPRAEGVVERWARDGRSASTHLVIDTDGQIVQCAPLLDRICFHARGRNEDSIGIEYVQKVYEKSAQRPSEVFRASIVSGAMLIFGLLLLNHPRVRVIDPVLRALRVRVGGWEGPQKPPRPATTTPGIFGHRDVSPQDRGRGDPGDFIMAGTALELDKLAQAAGVPWRAEAYGPSTP